MNILMIVIEPANCFVIDIVNNTDKYIVRNFVVDFVIIADNSIFYINKFGEVFTLHLA